MEKAFKIMSAKNLKDILVAYNKGVREEVFKRVSKMKRSEVEKLLRDKKKFDYKGISKIDEVSLFYEITGDKLDNFSLNFN